MLRCGLAPPEFLPDTLDLTEPEVNLNTYVPAEALVAIGTVSKILVEPEAKVTTGSALPSMLKVLN